MHHDQLVGTLTRFLQAKMARVIESDRVVFSDSVIHKVTEREEPGTSYVPMIDYAQVRHIKIPYDYSEADVATTEQYRRMGLSEVFIKQIRDSVPAQQAQRKEMFTQYVNSKYFSLAEGETLETVCAEFMAPPFPLTWIPLSAVPTRRELALNEHSTLYSLAAQMPPPDDVEYGPLYDNYMETCMSILSDEINIASDCTLYFNYRIVTRQVTVPKIVFYLVVVHPRQKKMC